MRTESMVLKQHDALLKQVVKPYHRAPRTSEITFLRKMMIGDQSDLDGPLGCCLKRGWCKPFKQNASTTYVISDEGRRIVDAEALARFS